ncbi:geranylgeranylglycerol-phosphate geranylgeranyltransferase, partial [Bacteroidota bacterium]
MRYMVINPYLKKQGLQLELSFIFFILLVLSVIFIAAGGFIMNDIIDRDLDRVNKPQKTIVNKSIKVRTANLLYLFFTITGLFLGYYVSYKINYLSFGHIYLICAGILYFYSINYNKQLFVGNLLISLLVAVVPLIVLVYEIPLQNQNNGAMIIKNGIDFRLLYIYLLTISSFAFLLNLIREIIKDIEDMEGDRLINKNTIPLYTGIQFAKYLVIALILFTIFLLGYFYFKYFKFLLGGIHLLVTIALPLCLVAYLLYLASEKRHFTKLSRLIKIIMFNGILFSFFIFFKYQYA